MLVVQGVRREESSPSCLQGTPSLSCFFAKKKPTCPRLSEVATFMVKKTSLKVKTEFTPD